ncbi:MAG TPA: hypothetical protein VJ793_19150 [Anaerolineae bacterium]|nr:hypothetical protein [Anaerolineae bacterium]
MLLLPFRYAAQPSLELSQGSPSVGPEDCHTLLQLSFKGALQYQPLANALLDSHAAQQTRFFGLNRFPAFP